MEKLNEAYDPFARRLQALAKGFEIDRIKGIPEKQFCQNEFLKSQVSSLKANFGNSLSFSSSFYTLLGMPLILIDKLWQNLKIGKA